MSLLEPMAIFAAVMEHGSITQAAKSLGVSKSWVSKTVRDLEASLETQLLVRTTRSLSLTEEGRTFLEYCKQAKTLETEALDAVREGQGEVTGRIRVSAPVTLGQAWMGQYVIAFTKAYPKVEVELVLDNRKCDLIKEGFDVAIRISQTLPAEYKAKTIAFMQQGVYASSAYLEMHGEPKTPDELGDHNCLIYLNPLPESSWLFQGAQRPIQIEVTGGPRFNYHFSMIEAAEAGLGLARLPNYSVLKQVKAGTLRSILTDYPMTPLPIHMVYPPTRQLPKRTRCFLDFYSREIPNPTVER